MSHLLRAVDSGHDGLSPQAPGHVPAARLPGHGPWRSSWPRSHEPPQQLPGPQPPDPRIVDRQQARRGQHERQDAGDRALRHLAQGDRPGRLRQDHQGESITTRWPPGRCHAATASGRTILGAISACCSESGRAPTTQGLGQGRHGIRVLLDLDAGLLHRRAPEVRRTPVQPDHRDDVLLLHG